MYSEGFGDASVSHELQAYKILRIKRLSPVPVFGNKRGFHSFHEIPEALRHVLLFLQRLHRNNISL